MTGNVARRRALFIVTSGLAAFVAGCGTVQQFDPAPEHLKTIEGRRAVPPAVTQLPAPPAPVPRPPQETYSVVVTDVPVKDVLFALARDAGVNIDVSGDLQGNVTINAIDQTLPQILDRISRQASIRYSLDNGTLVVLPDAPFWQSYRVDYVNLARTTEGEVTVATQIATAGGSVGEDEESGGGDESESNGSKTIVKNLSDNSLLERPRRQPAPADHRQEPGRGRRGRRRRSRSSSTPCRAWSASRRRASSTSRSRPTSTSSPPAPSARC